MMLKWLVTVLLNRLVFLLVLLLAVNAFTRTGCYVQDDPIGQISRALSSMRDLPEAFQKH
jgi:hypothetical protein